MILALLICSFSQLLNAQNLEIYRLDKLGDGLAMGGGISLALTGFLLKPRLAAPGPTEIMQLSAANINAFDQLATSNWSPNSAKLSDAMLVSGGIASLAIVFGGKRMRSDWQKVLVIGAETMLWVEGITFTTKKTVGRLRPFVYNAVVPLNRKTEGDTRQSFFSGHSSFIAAATFFSAKVYHDYHSTSPWRYAIWGGAGLISGSVAYLRVRAGKHFPSDVLTGLALGAAFGVLVPEFHRQKSRKRDSTQSLHWEIGPAIGLSGLRLGCRF